MDQTSLGAYKIVSVFLKNLTSKDDLVYTFVSDDDIAAEQLNIDALSEATHYIANNVISAVSDFKRGFLIYPNAGTSDTFTVRFRSNSVVAPVNQWAEALGGGGHKQAAAARIHATSIEDAISTVLGIVEDTK